MAKTQNLTVPRGSRVTLNFSNDPPGPLPGSVIHFTVARTKNSLVKMIAAKTCSVPDGTGSYTCVLEASDTNVAPGTYFWDTRVVNTGAETLLASGVFVITGIAELPQ